MAFTGAAVPTNTRGNHLFIALKPLNERKITRRRSSTGCAAQLNRLPVASTFLQASRISASATGSSALYQYTLQSDNVSDLTVWGPRMLRR